MKCRNSEEEHEKYLTIIYTRYVATIETIKIIVKLIDLSAVGPIKATLKKKQQSKQKQNKNNNKTKSPPQRTSIVTISRVIEDVQF